LCSVFIQNRHHGTSTPSDEYFDHTGNARKRKTSRLTQEEFTMPEGSNREREIAGQQYDPTRRALVRTGIALLLCLGSPFLSGFLWAAAVQTPASANQNVTLLFLGMMLLFLLGAILRSKDLNQEDRSSKIGLVRVWCWTEDIASRSAHLIVADYLIIFGVEEAYRTRSHSLSAIWAGVLMVAGLSIAGVYCGRRSVQQIVPSLQRAITENTVLLAAVAICGNIALQYHVIDELKTRLALPMLFCLGLACAPVLFVAWINQLFGLARKNSKMRSVIDWPTGCLCFGNHVLDAKRNP
jgi:hypothetical protein